MDERQLGGLWCHEVLVHLDAFVEGDLAPATLSAVREHVSGCDACAQFGAAYAQLVEGLRSHDQQELEPDQLARLRARLRQEG